MTWDAIADILACLSLVGGLFFMFVGALGVYRFPDAYNRVHAASKCTTLGLTGLLVAACFSIGDPVIVSKALITIAFTFVATPVGSHLISKAAHHAGAPMWDRTLSDELAEDKARPDMAASDDLIGIPGLDDNAPRRGAA
jgi:multicomponent Na+:H+ antiporter subunit G